MASRTFWVDFFGSLKYKIMSSASRDSLSFLLLTHIPFIPSSCLIALVRNSRTMMNRSGESGNPHLLPDSRGNDFSFSKLSMMLTIGLSYM
jgi:hypothetical protein